MNNIIKILGIIKRKLFGKYLERKLIMIGHSHVINNRNNYKKIKNLNNLDYKIFSQFGEDGIIDYLMKSLNITSPKYVEIGVGDYSECNTRFLYETTQPQGLIIDCISNFKNKVLKNINLWKGNLKILNKNINSENINKILEEEGFDKNVDLFSLDIDGIDYWILKKLPNGFSKTIVVEYNSTFGPDLEITVPNITNFERTKYHHSNLCFGASLRAIVRLLEKKGFVFVGTTISKVNAFFILKTEIDKINLDLPNTNDLSKFTDSNIRESRDSDGQLNFKKGTDKLNEISECEVIDLIDGKSKKIKEIFSLNL